jgi:uncharacterized protein DUF6496
MAKYGKKASSEVKQAMHERKHGELKSGASGKTVKSKKQAIAIGLSKARRAGVKLGPPRRGRTSTRTRKQAARDVAKGRSGSQRTSTRRSRAVRGALQREGRGAASHAALSKHAKQSARQRGPADRRAAARKAVATKGKAGRQAAARKAARTRKRRAS